jgi:hypothetical protein
VKLKQTGHLHSPAEHLNLLDVSALVELLCATRVAALILQKISIIKKMKDKKWNRGSLLWL